MKLTQLIWFVSVVVLTALSSMVLMILVKRMNEAPRLTMENVDFGETIQSNESMVVSTKIFNRSSQDVKLSTSADMTRFNGALFALKF